MSKSRLVSVSERLQSSLHKGKKTLIKPSSPKFSTTHKLVVGASTGTICNGRNIYKIYSDFPPTLAVIHMPEHFTAFFANRLDSLCQYM